MSQFRDDQIVRPAHRCTEMAEDPAVTADNWREHQRTFWLDRAQKALDRPRQAWSETAPEWCATDRDLWLLRCEGASLPAHPGVTEAIRELDVALAGIEGTPERKAAKLQKLRPRRFVRWWHTFKLWLGRLMGDE